MYHFWAKMTKLPWIRSFFRKTINIISISLLAPFIVQNCKTTLTGDPEFWGCTILGPEWPYKNFLEKNINIFFIYLFFSFLCKILKKIRRANPELGGCAIFEPKMNHLSKQEFFSENLLINLVAFIHTYLQFQTSKWDINLLMKYW